MGHSIKCYDNEMNEGLAWEYGPMNDNRDLLKLMSKINAIEIVNIDELNLSILRFKIDRLFNKIDKMFFNEIADGLEKGISKNHPRDYDANAETWDRMKINNYRKLAEN